MSPLAAFIEGELSTRGWSNDRAAAEAAKRGHYVTGETIRKARKDIYKEPMPPESIAAIAAALRVKPEKIQQLDNARWSLGAPASDVEQAVLKDPLLTGRDKDNLITLWRSMRGDDGVSRSEPRPG